MSEPWTRPDDWTDEDEASARAIVDGNRVDASAVFDSMEQDGDRMVILRPDPPADES